MTTLSTPTLRAFAPSRETSFNPSPSGEGQGWGLFVIPSVDIYYAAPPPTPPLKGRGE